MTDAQLTLSRGELITVHTDGRLHVHIWLDGRGILHTSLGNGEVDCVRIRSTDVVQDIATSDPTVNLHQLIV